MGNYLNPGNKGFCLALTAMLILTGCTNGRAAEQDPMNAEDGVLEEAFSEAERIVPEPEEASQNFRKAADISEEETVPEPEITETDWSEYFDGLNGTAVLYDAEKGNFKIYNKEQALTQRSPCSTFKIVSSLTALENKVIRMEDSTYPWSGEVFWNEKWNQDMDFGQAFRESCVWYFRRVIDEIGQENMQEALEKLSYGNCDISDWEGRQNTNNSNRALTGFWIESSLKISPKEQTEVMERIFGENSAYSEEARRELMQVMQVKGEEVLEERPDITLYGKTGMGKARGAVVDAWFTGYAKTEKGNTYFCVHLGETEGRNVSSTLAKEIAIRIVLDEC